MEEGESLLDTILEQDEGDCMDDVEMADAEEGEIVESRSTTEVDRRCDGSADAGNGRSHKQNRRRRGSKKRSKKKKSGSLPEVTDINRFVMNACKRLKEKKSYMVYTAVGCLGVSALRDLIGEVDAIQACGGQMTADGKRHRTGGGILWNILKVRQPTAYAEIMKKAKEFEKQFRQQNWNCAPGQRTNDSSKQLAGEAAEAVLGNDSEGAKLPEIQHEKSNVQQRKSVNERIRIPVSYDDLLGKEPVDAAIAT